MTSHPIAVGTRKQLFTDHRFIAQADGVTLHVNPPERRGPVLRGEQPWETGWVHSGQVIQEGDTLRLWYNANAAGDWGRNPEFQFCCATSTDGIHWERPSLGLVEFGGTKANNILAAKNGYVFLDENAPAEQRYKLLLNKSGDQETGGLYIATSPDGLRWTEQPPRVFPFIPDTTNQVIYDPRLGKYVAYVRSWAPKRKVARTEMDDPMQPWPYRKIAEPSTLWGEGYAPPPSYELPQAIEYDEFDPPEMDLYTPCVNLYPWAEDVYLAFPSPYLHFPEPPAGKYSNDGLLEVQLAVSRDGRRFERPDRGHAYIPLGIYGGPEGGSLYMCPGLVRMGDEIYQYYSAYAHTHGEYVGYARQAGIGGIHLAVQRLDGFMSADAAYTGGWLVTPLITFTGDRLELNINCGATGHTRVELRDANDVPIDGFAAQDCDPILGNHVHHTVTWQGQADLSHLAGQPVRMRLVMRQCKLYAFCFTGADGDAPNRQGRGGE